MPRPRTDFVLVHSDWLGSQALDLLDRARDVPLVVVRRRADEDLPMEYVALRRRRARRAFEQNLGEPVSRCLGAVPRDESLEVLTGPYGLMGVMDVEPALRGNAGGESGGGALAAGPVDPSPDAATGTATGIVTRGLSADLPTQVLLGADVSMLVQLTATVTGAGVVPVALPPGSRVDVVVRASGGLACVGRTDGSLQVSTPQSEAPIQFKLRAERAGAGSVTVHAFHDGVSVGRLVVTTTVVSEAPAAESCSTSHPISLGVGGGATPDLAIYVFEGSGEVSFRLQSADGRLNMKEFGPTRLNDPEGYFRGFYRDIERLKTSTPEERKDAQQKLAAKGMNLFDAVFPPDLRLLLWELRDRIGSMQITSEEPWVPWELCRMKGRVGGRVEEGRFFAEAFSISRWLFGVPAARLLQLRDMAIVVPTDSRLTRTADERTFLLSLGDGQARRVTEIKADRSTVIAEMARGSYDAWHFSGHAKADQDDADQFHIELEGRARLTPEDLSGWAENVLTPRPLVFLNACQSGRSGMSLTGPGGWARRLLRSDGDAASASAFLGTYWSVDDDAAFGFAKALYTALLAGRPIAEATRAARESIRTSDDPTWLAYTLYAHPHAVVGGAGG